MVQLFNVSPIYDQYLSVRPLYESEEVHFREPSYGTLFLIRSEIVLCFIESKSKLNCVSGTILTVKFV